MTIFAALVCEPVGQNALVLGVFGEEGMNSLPLWTVDVLVPDTLDLAQLVEQAAELILVDEQETSERHIGLMVLAGEYLFAETQGHIYRLTLGPEESLLSLCSGYQIFQQMTVPEIVKDVLTQAGLVGERIVFRLMGSYVPRAHTTQYDEATWSFLERLLADEGISYWFENTENGPACVFGDAVESHGELDRDPVIPFEDASSMVRPRAFTHFELAQHCVHDTVHVRDYDVRQPDVLIEGQTEPGALGYYEFPANVPEPVAKERAAIRLEQLQNRKAVATARGDCIRVQPGRILEVTGNSDAELDGRYIVRRVVHRFQRRGASGAGQANYEQRVELAPASKPQRPNVSRTALRVTGMDLAITTGPDGEEIHVNDLGDVKIRFPWDRSGISDDQSSTWVRCVQPALGGSMILPRMGWEVPVLYLDGNPDRPVVLGRVYNAQSMVPYGLPGGMSTSTLQSATSPNDGSTNEIRMGDNAGSQEMYIHASRDQTVTVGGSSTVDVGVNECHDVGLSLAVAVQGSQTRSISVNQLVSVGTDYATAVQGARAENVGALEHTKVTANRLLDSAANYSEVVGGAYAVQCNQANIDVKGAYAQLVKGSTAHTAGLGFGETVAGARSLKVGGAQMITLKKGYAEMIVGSKKVTAGASSVKADGQLSTAAKGKVSVKAASGKVKAGAEVVVAAPKITLNIKGKLSADALALAGGTLKITKGTTAVSGTIKRKGGSEIE